MLSGTASSLRSELTELIAKHARKDGEHETAISGLRLFRNSRPTGPVPSVYEPVLCVLSQGRKQLLLGKRIYAYTPDQFVIVTTDLSLSGQVTQATAKIPYLGLRLRVDFSELSSLLETDSVVKTVEPSSGVFVGDLDTELQDALVRLVRLLDRPNRIQVLFPLLQREILFLLLQTEVGVRLRAATRSAVTNQQILTVIRKMKRDFKKSLDMRSLAALAQQSESTFHRHFQRLTGLTPLQYQKRLRLQEARRLLLATPTNVSDAAYAVGYQSPNQFNREYRRLFGQAPGKNLRQIRAQHTNEPTPS